MRTAAISLLTVLSLCTALFAQSGKDGKFVLPKQAGVGVYQNEVPGVNEPALFKVGVDDRLQVLSSGRDRLRVRSDAGQVGWIEKRFVEATSGKKFMFDDAEVIGYLDNPTPVYIIDADSKDATPIKLDRSFADALRENVDRETVDRQSSGQ
jgi:hypothetical protein